MTAPTLLFLHGLGATSGVWADVINQLAWPGKIINAELPGHGLSPTQTDYTMGALASGVAQSCENEEEVVAVGHSLGACVAICLASGFFRPVVRSVVAVGVKVQWTETDVAIMAKVVEKHLPRRKKCLTHCRPFRRPESRFLKSRFDLEVWNRRTPHSQ